VNGPARDAHNLNGCTAAKETMMKRFLKNVFAILRKTEQNGSAGRPERPNPTPLLEVRSQVKAGSYDLRKTT
jgi:hypothetical protein